MLSVFAPYRVGVITSVGLDIYRGACKQVIDVDAAVRAECVFFTGVLAAGIGHKSSVRRPVELFHPSERLCRQFVRLAAEDVYASCDGEVSDRSDICAWGLGHPVIPVPVHKIFSYICLSFVESRVYVFRSLDRTGDGAYVEKHAPVRGEFEFGDSGRDVAYLSSCAQ